jgi:superfamily II DNA or RNA helicase
MTTPPPSTVLGRHGYVIRKDALEEAELVRIRQELTFVNGEDSSMYGAPAERFPVYAESVRKIYVPRYYGLSNYGDPELIHYAPTAAAAPVAVAEEALFTFKGALRDYQQEAIGALFQHYATDLGTGGIICMPCGFGKTRTTIFAIHKLQNMFARRAQPFKVIIVVHKEFLGEQWRQNIQELIPEARVGLIQANRVEVEGKNVVIAMLQSISMKDYPDSLFNQFDFAIFDECHHLAAKVFSKALLRVGCQYLLGLSATPTRADGCHDIFFLSLGPVVFKIDRAANDRALVHRIVVRSDNHEHFKETLNKFTGKRQMPTMINDLCAFADRNELIVNVMRTILAHEAGRKIIVLSSRRDDKHLKYFTALLTQAPIVKADGQVATFGYYMGRQAENKKKYQQSLKDTEGKDIILATMDLSKEGLDIKGLNTLIYATPIKGLERKKDLNGRPIECHTTIEQSIGRILREPPAERRLVPLVIDIIDHFSNFVQWGYTRNAFYKKAKYPLTRHEVSLPVRHCGAQQYDLHFLTDYAMFYADDATIAAAANGALKDDTSSGEGAAEEDADDCMIED